MILYYIKKTLTGGIFGGWGGVKVGHSVVRKDGLIALI